jgi:hypothetical protein
MSGKKTPAVISTITEKSDIVRGIAKDMGFVFKEDIIDGGKIVKFRFLLNSDETMRLISRIPRDVYAFSGIISFGVDEHHS